MNWEVHPLTGLGPVMIGMSPSQVATILDPLGPVRRTIQEDKSSFSESRSLNLPFITYIDERVCSIDTRPFIANVFYKHLNVFEGALYDVVRQLQIDNNGVRYAVGSYMFLNLGILLNGFANPAVEGRRTFDENDSDYDANERSLTIWKAGSFSNLVEQFPIIPNL